MPEEKKETNNLENTEPTTENDGWTIDFSKFSLWAETKAESSNVFQQTPENNPITNIQTSDNSIQPNENSSPIDQNQAKESTPIEEKNINNTQAPEQVSTQETTNIPENNEPVEEKSIMSQFNDTEEETNPDVQIENIVIDEDTSWGKEKPKLGSSWIGKRITKKINKDIQIIMLSYIITGISILAIIFMGIYNKYIWLASVSNQATEETFVERIKNITKSISEYTKINEYALRADKTDVLTNDNATNTTKKIVESKKLNYLHKKDILENNVNALVQDTIKNANNLDTIKKDIVKYGFIPEQIFSIIKDHQWINNIKKRIELMENIKFLTASKAFSYMDSFIKWFANNVWEDPLLIESKIQNFMVDAEKNIINYTNTCYLNPYEINNDCSTIKDFENYYKLIEPEKKVNTKFITQLANYIDNKLQDTELPTFSINFIWFNPKEDKVDFTIGLNTTSQDELALNKQGILTPHVFIVTNIINLLKQSLLIIGENIKADQIKTTPKTIRVWSTVFIVNSSSIQLSLPIQKGTQREISDFFNSK